MAIASRYGASLINVDHRHCHSTAARRELVAVLDLHPCRLPTGLVRRVYALRDYLLETFCRNRAEQRFAITNYEVPLQANRREFAMWFD